MKKLIVSGPYSDQPEFPKEPLENSRKYINQALDGLYELDEPLNELQANYDEFGLKHEYEGIGKLLKKRDKLEKELESFFWDFDKITD